MSKKCKLKKAAYFIGGGLGITIALITALICLMLIVYGIPIAFLVIVFNMDEETAIDAIVTVIGLLCLIVLVAFFGSITMNEADCD